MNAITGTQLSRLPLIDPHRADAGTYRPVSAEARAELPSAPRGLDVEISGAGRQYDLDAWLAFTHGTSLLVVDRGQVTYEWYADGLGPETLFLGASMSKSVLAHLVGRAVQAGVLRLCDDVSAHVPDLVATGYGCVRVQDLLTMTTGVDWYEDYRDPNSLASHLVAAFSVPPGDSRAVLRRIGRRHARGQQYAYCTADSQVLDWVRERATGLEYADDLARLWRDLGCTSDAAVGTDAHGVALGGGGVAATTRDWARVGMLAIDGHGQNARLLDSAWLDAAARPAYSFLAPGRLPSSITTHVGFGYHWWPMDTDGRRVAADGSRGQFIYVDRAEHVVVVKTSQWPYDDWLADRQYRDLSYLGLAEIAAAAVRARTA